MSNYVIMAGTSSHSLASEICDILDAKVADVTVTRFSDGEVSCEINESIRGKDVFIVQSCAAPVNDSIMELLLTISALRRSGAQSITAVIPYFGYKFHRQRGLPISTAYHSRFLWNAAGDVAKMLAVAGVDKVVSVDLQRPGQGHEACFFESTVPVESISTNDVFVKHFHEKVKLQGPVVIVSPNTEFVKKAKRFQRKLKALTGLEKIEYAAFLEDDRVDTNITAGASSTLYNTGRFTNTQLMGNVRGADVIIIDDIVDTAGSLSLLCRQLVKEGAKRVFVCASHGLFSEKAMELIDLSPVELVVVSDSLTLPEMHSPKISQVKIAPMLAKIIETELHNMQGYEKNDDGTAEDDDEGDFELE